MPRVFEILKVSDLCYGDIKGCVELSYENFQSYTINSQCGTGNDPYNIFTLQNEQVFSAKIAPYSITFKLLHNSINPISFYIEMRPNNDGCYWAYPNNFSFLGGSDADDWIDLHSETGNKLDTRQQLIEIPVKKTKKYFQYFKFIAHSIDTVATEIYSSISRIEINGNFYYKQKCSIIQKTCFPSYIQYIFVFILS